MCVVSMIMDHYGDEWERRRRQWTPVLPAVPFVPTSPHPITQSEIDEFRRLLDRAREYDRKHHEPDCELNEKRERIKKLAAELGVDVSFVDSNPESSQGRES